MYIILARPAFSVNKRIYKRLDDYLWLIRFACFVR